MPAILCIRCHTRVGTMTAFPPSPGPGKVWRPVPGALFCMGCGSNGRNVLTPDEYAAVTKPATDEQAVLPYPEPGGEEHTSGWSGSDTSRERAVADDASGETSRRQRLVLNLLRDAGARGLTWKELSTSTGMHHGQASGALSNLHLAGRVARLSERRGRCHPYTLPEYVGGRETDPHGGRAARRVTVSPVEYARTITDAQHRAWGEGYAAALEWTRDIGQPEPENPYPAPEAPRG